MVFCAHIEGFVPTRHGGLGRVRDFEAAFLKTASGMLTFPIAAEAGTRYLFTGPRANLDAVKSKMDVAFEGKQVPLL